MVHAKRTSERRVETPQTTFVNFLHRKLLSQQPHLQVTTSSPPVANQVSALCFAHQHSRILLVRRHRLECCDGGTRQRVVVCPYTTVLHCAPEKLCGFPVAENTSQSHLLDVMSNALHTLIGVKEASSTSCQVVVTVRKDLQCAVHQ